MKRRHIAACQQKYISLTLVSIFLSSLIPDAAIAAPPRTPDQTVECEILVVGGGLSGVATAYEGLLAGRTVCLTEITDWVGGQISAQGTSASAINSPVSVASMTYQLGALPFARQLLQRGEPPQRTGSSCLRNGTKRRIVLANAGEFLY